MNLVFQDMMPTPKLENMVRIFTTMCAAVLLSCTFI